MKDEVESDIPQGQTNTLRREAIECPKGGPLTIIFGIRRYAYSLAGRQLESPSWYA